MALGFHPFTQIFRFNILHGPTNIPRRLSPSALRAAGGGGALLKTGDEDADAHYALGDTLVTVARIAGIPVRFRLALVVSSRQAEAVYRALQSELRALGCDARVFRLEPRAVQWLCGGGRAVRSRAGETALT